MSDEKQKAESQVVLEAGMALAAIRESDGLKHVVTPAGCGVVTLPDMREHPSRRTGTVTVRSVESFLALVERERTDATEIFCDFSLAEPQCRAVIDFHEKAIGGQRAGWCEYDIVLKLSQSHEWKQWCGLFGRKVPQVEFAEFIEEHNCDVHMPAGADILEVALTLQEKKQVEFVGGTRLQNGDTHLVFAEKSEAKAGRKGELDIPSDITLFIPPYEGFGSQFVKCKLRYRIEGGDLYFTVKPMNVNDMLRRTREHITTAIREATKLVVAEGSFVKSSRVV